VSGTLEEAMHPEQIRLTGARETLLITLQAKAIESAMPDSLLRDRFAADALHRQSGFSAAMDVVKDTVLLAPRPKEEEDQQGPFRTQACCNSLTRLRLAEACGAVFFTHSR
jgi:O-methyltransferase involved in polyketide biosynthesis